MKNITLDSSNLGVNLDYPDSRLIRDGDTLTLSFETTERISTKDDLEGSRKPSVSFYYGEKELEVSDQNINLQTSDDNGTLWQAELLIDGNSDILKNNEGKNNEGYLGFKVAVFDKAGNRGVIEFSDNGTALVQTRFVNQQKPTDNPSGKRARFDTKLPEIQHFRLRFNQSCFQSC